MCHLRPDDMCSSWMDAGLLHPAALQLHWSIFCWITLVLVYTHTPAPRQEGLRTVHVTPIMLSYDCLRM